MSKKLIRLRVKVRKNNKGSYIASVPLKQLLKFSKCPYEHRHWNFEDGWLLLEAY